MGREGGCNCGGSKRWTPQEQAGQQERPAGGGRPASYFGGGSRPQQERPIWNGPQPKES